MGRRRRAERQPDEAGRIRDLVSDKFGGSTRKFWQAVKKVRGLQGYASVHAIVRGDRAPSDSQRETIANALGVTPIFLATGLTWREFVLSGQDLFTQHGLTVRNPDDVAVICRLDLGGNPLRDRRRRALLRLADLLHDVEPVPVPRGPRRVELRWRFDQPAVRAEVLKKAARYLLAAEEQLKASDAQDIVVSPTTLGRYPLWADSVLRTFADRVVDIGE